MLMFVTAEKMFTAGTFIGAEWCIYASANLIISDSEYRFGPIQRQVIIWTTFGFILNARLIKNINQTKIKIPSLLHRNLDLKMLSQNGGHNLYASIIIIEKIQMVSFQNFIASNE